MFKTFGGPLPIHLCWYELALSTYRSDDLSVASSRGEEQDARDKIRLYKDAMEFDDPLVHALTQQE